MPAARGRRSPTGARRRPERDSDLCGLHPCLEALRARRRSLRRLRVRRGRRRPELERVVSAAQRAGVPVEEIEEEEIARRIPPGVNAQGVLLEAGPLPEIALSELPAAGEVPRIVLALDGVEDPQNVGAVARVAEAAGASGLVLTRRRAPPLSPALARASAGAIEWLPVARVPNLPRALKQLKENGFWALGGSSTQGLNLFSLPERVVTANLVLVLGSEGRGLRPGVATRLDERVRIPLAGRVGSLNVAAAAAVLLFELKRRAGLARRR